MSEIIYTIEITGKDGSDLVSFNHECVGNYALFDDDKFGNEYVFNPNNIFPRSVIVFNEDIDDAECMSITKNLCDLRKSRKTFNCEIARTIVALELLQFKDKEYMEKLKDSIPMKDVKKIRETTKIFHLN